MSSKNENKIQRFLTMKKPEASFVLEMLKKYSGVKVKESTLKDFVLKNDSLTLYICPLGAKIKSIRHKELNVLKNCKISLCFPGTEANNDKSNLFCADDEVFDVFEKTDTRFYGGIISDELSLLKYNNKFCLEVEYELNSDVINCAWTIENRDNKDINFSLSISHKGTKDIKSYVTVTEDAHEFIVTNDDESITIKSAKETLKINEKHTLSYSYKISSDNICIF